MTVLTNGDDWYDHASCRQYSHKLFFPEVGRGNSTGKAFKKARSICATCPVSSMCFTTALKNNEEYGIWGGVNFSRKCVGSAKQNIERIKKDYIAFIKWKIQ